MKKTVVANIKNRIENGELEKTYKNTGDFKLTMPDVWDACIYCAENYLDKIISDWHEKSLNTQDEIQTYLKEQKQKAKEIKAMQAKANPDQVSLQKFFDSNDQYSDISNFYANM